MRNRDERSHGSPWNEENVRKAFKDRFGLPRKEMLAKPLTGVQSATRIRIMCFLILSLIVWIQPQIIIQCVLPLLDLATDYINTFLMVSSKMSPVSSAIGFAMLVSVCNVIAFVFILLF